MSAVFSLDFIYRYRLDREFMGTEQRAVFIMLNPSTANEREDDPTIRRCIGFAKAWGCAGLTVLNLFAFRATNPEALKITPDPVGPENDRHIRSVCEGAVVICAWGNLGAMNARAEAVMRILEEVGAEPASLKLNGTGQPAHPLYLRADLKPEFYRAHEEGETR